MEEITVGVCYSEFTNTTTVDFYEYDNDEPTDGWEEYGNHTQKYYAECEELSGDLMFSSDGCRYYEIDS